MVIWVRIVEVYKRTFRKKECNQPEPFARVKITVIRDTEDSGAEIGIIVVSKTKIFECES
jgi:hypothetical protein